MYRVFTVRRVHTGQEKNDSSESLDLPLRATKLTICSPSTPSLRQNGTFFGIKVTESTNVNNLYKAYKYIHGSFNTT